MKEIDERPVLDDATDRRSGERSGKAGRREQFVEPRSGRLMLDFAGELLDDFGNAAQGRDIDATGDEGVREVADRGCRVDASGKIRMIVETTAQDRIGHDLNPWLGAPGRSVRK